MEEIIFGVAYYPEYMPYERMETDLAWIREAGMNTVRMAESTWSTWEPREGEFDFSILERALLACEKAGLKVIIGTPTYAVPAWLAKKDPEVMAQTKGGRIPYGARQSIDILSPTYRFHAKRLMEKLLEVTGKYDCVIGYQLDNETKYYDCTSRYFLEGFQSFLKERFGSVEEMNRAYGLAYWSNALSSWEDLPSPVGTINASMGAAFDEYRRGVAADFLKWQRGIVEPCLRPGQFLTQNFDLSWEPMEDVAPLGCSTGVQRGIDHYQAREAITLAGIDIYHPTQEALTGEQIAFGGAEAWSLKEKPYLVLETQAQAFPEWTPYPGQLRLCALAHLASGARGLLYWNWHSIHNSFETYWRGVLSHDLKKNRIYGEVSQIGRLLEGLSPSLTGCQRKKAVALVIDPVSQDALTWFPIHGGVTYNDLVRQYHDLLYRLNIPCDVLDGAALLERGTKGYAGIVTPGTYCVSEKMIELLRSFVEEGGVLVSSLRSFVADRNLKVYADTLPYGMTDCFGVSYQELTRSGGTKVGGREVKSLLELLMPQEDTQVLLLYEHPVWGTYSAVTSHRFGKGRAIYVGAVLEDEVLEGVLLDAFGALADESGARWPLIVKRLTNEKGEEIVFLLNFSDREQKLTWQGKKAQELTEQEPVLFGQDLFLGPWEGKVVRTI